MGVQHKLHFSHNYMLQALYVLNFQLIFSQFKEVGLYYSKYDHQATWFVTNCVILAVCDGCLYVTWQDCFYHLTYLVRKLLS